VPCEEGRRGDIIDETDDEALLGTAPRRSTHKQMLFFAVDSIAIRLGRAHGLVR
jgi:hypothetical protein